MSLHDRIFAQFSKPCELPNLNFRGLINSICRTETKITIKLADCLNHNTISTIFPSFLSRPQFEPNDVRAYFQYVVEKTYGAKAVKFFVQDTKNTFILSKNN